MSWGRAIWTAAKWWLLMFTGIGAVYGLVVAAIFFPLVMLVIILVSGFAVTVWAVRL